MKKQTLLLVLVAVQIGLCIFSYVVGVRDRGRIAQAARRLSADATPEEYRQFLTVASEDRRGTFIFMVMCLVALCVDGAAILIVSFRLKPESINSVQPTAGRSAPSGG